MATSYRSAVVGTVRGDLDDPYRVLGLAIVAQAVEDADRLETADKVVGGSYAVGRYSRLDLRAFVQGNWLRELCVALDLDQSIIRERLVRTEHMCYNASK